VPAPHRGSIRRRDIPHRRDRCRLPRAIPHPRAGSLGW
jgi:hypothetical protein